ncbi:hypothetical protein K443DRAFT_682370 [Laccaria amethystina LaAM-08-1]|uniref:Uncharacterized protein n=1 Tax=Laccaria amethystina LaAM-08-1 TaxID=1095629 RepID=A0A0C9XFA1_9AGAR|nr:hypothetical protein K443DRAFT_682370 [Laccaria amethystina LaAM-08-1]
MGAVCRMILGVPVSLSAGMRSSDDRGWDCSKKEGMQRHCEGGDKVTVSFVETYRAHLPTYSLALAHHRKPFRELGFGYKQA